MSSHLPTLFPPLRFKPDGYENTDIARAHVRNGAKFVLSSTFFALVVGHKHLHIDTSLCGVHHTQRACRIMIAVLLRDAGNLVPLHAAYI